MRRGESGERCVERLGEPRRLEVAWSKDRPVLLCTVDMGSCGFPAKRMLFSNSTGACLRGFFDLDPCHRRHNNVMHSLQSSGLGWAKAEVAISQNMSSAPWGTNAFYNSLKAAAEELFDSWDLSEEIFQVYYPRIAFELSAGRLAPDFGSPHHIDEVFAAARAAWPLHRKGSRTRTGRWFQIFDREKENLPYWGVLAMVLHYIGLVSGWAAVGVDGVEAAEQTPSVGVASSTCGSGGAQAPAVRALPPSGASAAASVPKQQVAQSNRDVEALRSKAENYQHLTLMIYGNTTLRSLWLLVDRITDPIKLEHSATTVTTKTRKGCRLAGGTIISAIRCDSTVSTDLSERLLVSVFLSPEANTSLSCFLAGGVRRWPRIGPS